MRLSTQRVEGLSDGFLAIVITIMVLELKAPEEGTLHAFLTTNGATLLAYGVSFVFLGVYWGNHHRLLLTADPNRPVQGCGATGRVIWSNLHLLWWLSLIPFGSAWLGRSGFQALPLATYGAILTGVSGAWLLLEHSIADRRRGESILTRALGRNTKGWLTGTLHAASVPLAFVSRVGAGLLLVVIVALWLVPEPRISRTLESIR